MQITHTNKTINNNVIRSREYFGPFIYCLDVNDLLFKSIRIEQPDSIIPHKIFRLSGEAFGHLGLGDV